MSTANGSVERLAQMIRDARSAVALTGAGISVPSGIPDFRSPGTGLWETVDPMEVAHIDVFRRDPKRFWTYYRPRFGALADKEPNPAHAALAELESRGLLDAVITQNIDRLHREAGSRRVVEVHGTIETSSCLDCGASYTLDLVRRRCSTTTGSRAARLCAGRSSRTSSSSASYCRSGDDEARARRGRGSPALRRVLARGAPGRGAARDHARAGGAVAIVTKGPTPYDGEADVRLDGDVVEDDLECAARGT